MKEIVKGVYQIPVFPRELINCYVINDVLVDAGIRSSANKILKALQTTKINAHLLTHAHADHQGSSAKICKALNIPLITSAPELVNAESGKVTGEYPNPQHLVARLQQRFWAGPGHKVSALVKEGDEVCGFTIIETPGHAKGHLSLFREKDRVLIAGDALVNINFFTTLPGLALPPNVFTTNKEEAVRSVIKLARLKPKLICFGHGPALINNGQLDRLVEKLSRNQ